MSRDQHLEFEIAILFPWGWWNEDAHGGRVAVLPEGTVAWLSERLKDLKMLSEGDGLHSRQVLTATSAPMRLQNTMVFPHKSLPN